MKNVELGRSGIKVAPFAFGGNVFGWTADEKRSFELLDAFLDAGFNLIDTADVYSIWIEGHVGGESETIIGRWLAKRNCRGKVVIATKLGMKMGPDSHGLSRRYMRIAVERSLQRLATDYIDLYQAHSDDEDTPLEETLGAFAELIDEGKVRAIGASNYTAPRLAQALRVSELNGLPRYETLQPHYNLYERNRFEGELAELCANENIGVIPYFALAAGFLTGKYRSEKDVAGRERARMVANMLNARGLRILEALDDVAGLHAATPAQIALAWLLAKGVAAPIASATSPDQLRELMAAVNIELARDELAQLDAASAD
jgi:aryl-alcohol dehydrogenase-like predicted oxidoreductase